MTGKDVLLFSSAIGGVLLLVAGLVIVEYVGRLRSRAGTVPVKPHEAEQVPPTVVTIGIRVERLEDRVAVIHWGAAFLLGDVAVLTWQALKPVWAPGRTRLVGPARLGACETGTRKSRRGRRNVGSGVA